VTTGGIVAQFETTVEIRLREGISDPQSQTIQRSIPALGFTGVSNVKMGKSIHMTVDAENEAAAREKVQQLCQTLLTNPVIEDAIVTVK
jgi:phosphoribosylformylglycinamidine synthase PurS subunit